MYEKTTASTIPDFTRYAATAGGKIIHKSIQQTIPQRDDGRGYRCVSLRDDEGHVKTRKVHRLVYAAFHGEIKKGMHIDHIDHNKTNNSIENLRERDPSENSADCHRGSRKGARRLNDKQKRMLALLCLTGHQTKEVADLCGIGSTTVRRIKKQAKKLLAEV